MIGSLFPARAFPPSAFAARDRPRPANGYDVIVIGGGALASALARACAGNGAAVAMLAPDAIEPTPAERAWPVVRAAHPDAGRIAIQADAPQRLAKLARWLTPSPMAERTGCLTLGLDEDRVRTLGVESGHAKAHGVEAWMVPAREVAALAPPLGRGRGFAPAQHEAGAMVVEADCLTLGLARAAEEAGAAIFPGARVDALARDGQAVIGVELGGRFVRAGAVALADDASAIRLVREGRGRLSLRREERTALTTGAGAPELGAAVIAGDLTLARGATGAATLSGPHGADALAARAIALAPELAALEVASEQPVTLWTGVDGHAQIGPADIDGLWLALGFGRDALSPVFAAAEHLAAALGGGRDDPAFAPFAPTRRAAPRLSEMAS
ncbi:NAD(P)/FAD-dependent oxidoreductase [Methylopila turkensis]|uniref:FAD dependent oxidoreductase domain-containing protein n=1 Tax=Methylopila turkensis TaxID=1437816 RepID=A0A9W6JQI2_9HYPH|nr:FAD-dependent oxidoreductase [Methylopila turkensis]GLK81427.1 hypothetical protein GCM10008174_31680 [Methylopila turkensis]